MPTQCNYENLPVGERNSSLYSASPVDIRRKSCVNERRSFRLTSCWTVKLKNKGYKVLDDWADSVAIIVRVLGVLLCSSQLSSGFQRSSCLSYARTGIMVFFRFFLLFLVALA